jgi:hypothetical protein
MERRIQRWRNSTDHERFLKRRLWWLAGIDDWSWRRTIWAMLVKGGTYEAPTIMARV